MNNSRKRIVASFLISAALTFVFMRFSDVTTQGKWNTSHPAYKAQVEAFLAGRLALKQTPFDLFPDAVWGNGAQQGWGLGVPIITVFFELPARLFSKTGFPDVIQFIIIYALICALIIDTSFFAIEKIFPGSKSAYFLAVPVVLTTVTSPAIFRLLQSQLLVYEMAIAYAVLWTFLVLSLLVRAVLDPDSFSPWLLGICAAFVCLIKVTYVFYGAAAVVAAALFVKTTARKRLLVCMIFALGPVSVLVTNQLRFGSPLEFGYHLNVNGDPVNNALLRFGTPFDRETFAGAAEELMGALFFVNTPENFKNKIEFVGQSPLARYRANAFSVFLFVDFCLLLAGWSIALRKRTPAASALILVSISAFVGLFGFYLRAPTLASRYCLDFLPAIAAASIVTYFAFAKYICHMKIPSFSQGSLASAFVLVFAVAAIHYFLEIQWGYLSPNRGAEFDSADKTLQKVVDFTLDTEKDPLDPSIALPNEYVCSKSEDIYPERIGWNQKSDCTVSASTGLFLQDVQCLEINFKPLSEMDTSVLAVRVDRDFYKKVFERSSGSGISSVFCSESVPKKEAPRGRYNFAVIRWIDTGKTLYDPVPVKLISVRKRNYDSVVFSTDRL